jgi:gliding motility-associated-like protein
MRKRVVVFGKPTADFTAPSSVCVGTPVTFINTSQLGWGSTQFTQTSWNFGTTATSSNFSPTYTYATPGNYTVTLIVKSDSSCVESVKTKVITVVGTPKADFKYSSSCANVPIQFTNLSSGGFGETGYSVVRWSFGVGSQTSTQVNPSFTYTNPGTYTVELIISGINCASLTDTIRKNIIIRNPRPDSTYPRIFASKLNRFSMVATPGGISYLWTPPIGLITPTRPLTDVYYLPADPSKIIYNISIKDSSGCVNNDKQEVWIFEKPDVFVPTAFTPTNSPTKNDLFKPFYINIQSLKSFRIFSRWGVKVFETNDMTKAWDGTINNAPAPLESYSWVVECYDINGNLIVKKGMVTLIKY